MENIVKKNEKEQSIRFPPQNHIDAFLAEIAPVLEKLPPRDWFYAKEESLPLSRSMNIIC